MSTGDQSSVSFLYNVLKNHTSNDDVEDVNISHSMIREQLYREYGVQPSDGDEAQAGFRDPTKEEYAEVCTFLDFHTEETS